MFQIQTLQPTHLRAPSRHRLSTTASLVSTSTLTIPTSTTSKNHSIQTLCRKGKLKQAIQLLSHEDNPTQLTYNLLIQSCAQNHSFSDAFAVHTCLTQDGFAQDPFLATKLINMYAELGSSHHARQVFDEITEKTIYVWNAIFRALAMLGDGEEALRLYRRMNWIGMPSDRFTYTYVLKACVVSGFERLRGKEVHAQVLRRGHERQLHVMTTLVDMYAKFGCVESARQVFDSMPAKNLVSWSAMIACFAKNARPLEALEVFGEMMREGSDDVLPNSVTLVSVVQACATLAALEQGKLIHGYVVRKGLDSILPVMNALVTMYARCGDVELGENVFNQMEKRDVVSWNSMISSYAVHGLGSKALATFQEMVKRGVSPTPVTFISVLGACSHSGLVDEGKMLFDSMTREHGIRPSVEHYACIVDLLGRANRLEEAARIIADMRDEPGAMVWGALLGSCRIHCNMELAERASRMLFELEPTNAGNYVLLAEIYAEAKMWGEVKRVKKLLEEKGLQKVPGWCWIEAKKRVYSIRSVDEVNPQIELVHALVVKLSEEMMEQGYVPETKSVLYELDTEEKQRVLLGHSEKLAVAFGLINCRRGETIRISKNLRLCEDCHSFTKFMSKFGDREIMVRDINRFHHFRDGKCSCGDYW
ncbi:pentatricopeptide repeat-containing protein At3g46790, chloroplastic-like [Salvia splendens]|uniref:pentatricopeptide repeat-containing protein At3g46790, chloroplastic-like n=1 Tax=Salvia splendens TaxID=180675 RepID=UPI00110112FD|nr:pentatricopeptide repeat-containing protein At3g46790, chloroplastic-like [Salvia splendens]